MYGVDKMFLMMEKQKNRGQDGAGYASIKFDLNPGCLLYTSPSPRDAHESRMPSSA